MSRGFTFVEVLATLAVAGLGMLAVVGLVRSGQEAAGRAQMEAVGMATAISVAHDPTPLLSAEHAADWSHASYAMDGTGALAAHSVGWVNGLYVVREERSAAEDVIAKDGATVFARAADVVVEVFDGQGGRPVASFATRVVRQRGMP